MAPKVKKRKNISIKETRIKQKKKHTHTLIKPNEKHKFLFMV